MPETGSPASANRSVRPVEIIAYLISPIHLIDALGAAKALHGDRPLRVSVWVHWPYAELAQVEQLLGVIATMSSRMPEVVSAQPITTEMLSGVMGRPDAAVAASELRVRLGSESFDEIYYSHDVVGEFFWALAEAYPGARRICFGDGLGIVYQRKYHLEVSYPPVDENGEPLPPRLDDEDDHVPPAAIEPVAPPVVKPSGIARLLKWFSGANATDAAPVAPPGVVPEPPSAPFGTTAVKPHIAGLILPVDQSGRFLRGVELRTVPKGVVLDLIDQAAAGCTDFLAHTEAILADCGDRPKFLLITENNAEGECITFEREIEMYCSIVRERAPAGSAIILKSHPGETLPRNEALTAELQNDYAVFRIDPGFKRYPIELAKRLLHESQPICMSYPTLSLKYLYDIDVMQPMDDAFIERWFPKRFWPAYKNSLLLYDEPLKRLKDWDGRSLLWQGNDAQATAG